MTNGRIKRGAVAILFFFATILTGCHHKDVYSTDIEEGTYTARIIYQYSVISSSLSDFSVEISETTLKVNAFLNKPFEGELYDSTLTSDSWLEYPEMQYSKRRYWTEDILDKLMLTENILEANQRYDVSYSNDPDYYYVEYYGIFKLNKKIYMVFQLSNRDYPERGEILRIWELEKASSKE